MKFNLNHRVVLAALALFVLGSVASVQAVTSTGNMTVTAEVEASCTVSASPMAFGTVIPGTTTDTTAIVTVTCTNTTAYTVDLGDGLNPIGTGADYRRQMAAAAVMLPYAVYKDSTWATAIGPSAPSTLNNLETTGVGTGEPQETTIYGQIKGDETATQNPGAYSDTVVITVAY